MTLYWAIRVSWTIFNKCRHWPQSRFGMDKLTTNVNYKRVCICHCAQDRDVGRREDISTNKGIAGETIMEGLQAQYVSRDTALAGWTWQNLSLRRSILASLLMNLRKSKVSVPQFPLLKNEANTTYTRQILGRSRKNTDTDICVHVCMNV